MDTISLVAEQIEDGRRLIERLAGESFPIDAAFWGIEEDESSWSLFIGTPIVQSNGLPIAYHPVRLAMKEMSFRSMTIGNVRMLASNHPLTQEVTKLLSSRQSQSFVNFGARRILLGYIYPTSLYQFEIGAMSAAQLVDRVSALLQRTTTSTPVVVQLKSGGSFPGIPFGLEARNGQELDVKFVDASTMLPRIEAIENITAIH